MKAIEQYFPVVLFIMLYKVIVMFQSLDKILQSLAIQMKRSYWALQYSSEISDQKLTR